MRVKICGIRSVEDALTAISAGADAVGFLVGITHLAEDKISNEEAKKIIDYLPPFVSTVAVTHLQDIDKIVEMCEYLGVNTLQIHDYLSPENVLECKKRLPGIKLLKAIHVMQSCDEALEMSHSYENIVDAIILDSRTKDRLGGTGNVHDWNISKKIVEEISIPVILAGGLTDENVYDAVKKVNPYAVDVNSGVEMNGFKDFKKVKRFVDDSKKADLELKGLD